MRRPIALFSPDMCGGGAERVTLILAQEFSRRNVSVDLVLSRAVGPYLNELSEEVRVVDLASDGVFRSIPGLVNYFHIEKPLAMLSTQMHANVAALAARRIARSSVRLVVREANVIALPTEWRMRMRVRALLALARFSYPWSDGVVAVSNGVATAIHQGIGISSEKVSVIYNPVIRPEMQVLAKEPIQHPWFIDSDVPVVLSVGRLEEQKDFFTLINAFSAVRKQVRARLVIFGEGSQRRALEDLIHTLNLDSDVSLPGFTKNPYSYMARAAVYVLSSAWEGLPNALIEAMSLGVPVVATDCESGPREIMADGGNGHLVRVGDALMLAQGILAALTQDDYPLINADGLKRFHVDHVVNQYLQLLKGT